MVKLTRKAAFTLLFTMAAGAVAQDAVTGATSKSRKMKMTEKTEDFEKFRFGGYGEILGQFMNYTPNTLYNGRMTGIHTSSNAVSIPRFVIAGDYKFSKRWTLGAEIEFEAGGVGVATEMENSENNEYEVEYEKGGEVALEQMHITYHAFDALNIRVGHMIVPVGLTNAHHDPILFFGTQRPESETVILPSTWHETGLQLFGNAGKGFGKIDYSAMVVTGLSADGFGRDNWIAKGKQGLFEKDCFTSPAYVGRLDYSGVPGLRVGLSYYYCRDAASNADKPYKYTTTRDGRFRVPVQLLTADAQYKNKLVTARANVIWGEVGNSTLVSKVSLSNKSPLYHSIGTGMRNTAKNALAYGAEIGINMRTLTGKKKCPVLYPFARYEYYNPQQKGESTQTMDSRLQVSKWVGGVNWFALPNLVVKADYSTRRIGTQRVFGGGSGIRENEFAIAVAYTGWFTKR